MNSLFGLFFLYFYNVRPFISKYVSRGLFDDAMNVFKLMKKFQLAPSIPDYHQVLHLCLIEKKMEKGELLY